MSIPHVLSGAGATSAEQNAFIDAYNATAAALAAQLHPMSYAVIVANVLNTITETDVLHFTVPAGVWADMECIWVPIPALIKNNSGGNARVTSKVNVGSGAQVTLTNWIGGTGTSLLCGDSATEYQKILYLFLRRVGADVWIDSELRQSVSNSANSPTLAESHIDGKSTPANFTGTNVVTLKMTWDTADATTYVKPQGAQVVHLRAA